MQIDIYQLPSEHRAAGINADRFTTTGGSKTYTKSSVTNVTRYGHGVEYLG